MSKEDIKTQCKPVESGEENMAVQIYFLIFIYVTTCIWEKVRYQDRP